MGYKISKLELAGLKLELATMKMVVHAAKYRTPADYSAHMKRLRGAVRKAGFTTVADSQ